jgi:hypothetical protein
MPVAIPSASFRSQQAVDSLQSSARLVLSHPDDENPVRGPARRCAGLRAERESEGHSG